MNVIPPQLFVPQNNHVSAPHMFQMATALLPPPESLQATAISVPLLNLDLGDNSMQHRPSSLSNPQDRQSASLQLVAGQPQPLSELESISISGLHSLKDPLLLQLPSASPMPSPINTLQYLGPPDSSMKLSPDSVACLPPNTLNLALMLPQQIPPFLQSGMEFMFLLA
jgi:hypothetical protein